MRDLPPADAELRVQRERAVRQLGYAFALVRQLGDADAKRLDDFVCALIASGAVDGIDTMLEHLEVASGAWRELADLADCAIERVAAALTRQVISRAAVVESGTA
jgi:hypothetical protein